MLCSVLLILLPVSPPCPGTATSVLLSPANPTGPLCDQTMPEHQGQEQSSSTSGHPEVDDSEDSRWLCPFCLLFSPPWPQVLYRWNRQSSTSVIETNKTSVELSLPFDEDYIIEIKPFSDGGDGSSSEQIRIPKISNAYARGSGSSTSSACTLSALSTIMISLTARSSL